MSSTFVLLLSLSFLCSRPLPVLVLLLFLSCSFLFLLLALLWCIGYFLWALRSRLARAPVWLSSGVLHGTLSVRPQETGLNRQW